MLICAERPFHRRLIGYPVLDIPFVFRMYLHFQSPFTCPVFWLCLLHFLRVWSEAPGDKLIMDSNMMEMSGRNIVRATGDTSLIDNNGGMTRDETLMMQMGKKEQLNV